MGENNGVGLVFILDVAGQSEIFPICWDGLPPKSNTNGTWNLSDR